MHGCGGIPQVSQVFTVLAEMVIHVVVPRAFLDIF
jgi:hypothetical protein